MRNKKIAIIGGMVAIVVLLFYILSLQFTAPQSQAQNDVFTVAPGTEEKAVSRLKELGYIKSLWAFQLALTLQGKQEVQPGGYTISKSMDAWKLAHTVTSEPTMKWITIPEGLRKEEIGERLAKALHWSDEEMDKWNKTYTAMQFDYVEGVYFPDTYLIPVNENGLDTANRMINRFNERFAGYPEKFSEQDIKWTTALKIASIAQREAAGKEDMPLIAGILWNRLLKDQSLEIDATVQYARGKTDSGWWSPIKASDIQDIDSPYNTYKNKGLPPTPISNPGIDAIDAVLSPTETDCIYYIHDENRQIHCSKTFAEHESLIDKYLR